jgi:hypothetical protein
MKFCSFNVFHHNISQKQARQQANNAGKRRIGAGEGGVFRGRLLYEAAWEVGWMGRDGSGAGHA